MGSTFGFAASGVHVTSASFLWGLSHSSPVRSASRRGHCRRTVQPADRAESLRFLCRAQRGVARGHGHQRFAAILAVEMLLASGPLWSSKLMTSLAMEAMKALTSSPFKKN